MNVEELLVLVDVSAYVGRSCRFCLGDTGHHHGCAMLRPVDAAKLIEQLVSHLPAQWPFGEPGPGDSAK